MILNKTCQTYRSVKRQISNKFSFIRTDGNEAKLLNLMICGARRSGTTSLEYYLSEHPQIEFGSIDDYLPYGDPDIGYPYDSPFTALTCIDENYKTYIKARVNFSKYVTYI